LGLALSIGPPVEIDVRASNLVFVGGLVFGVVNAGSPARPCADPDRA